MSYSKYTRLEKQIARKITMIDSRMYRLRRIYLDLDVKKQALKSLLNGKYKEKRER